MGARTNPLRWTVHNMPEELRILKHWPDCSESALERHATFEGEGDQRREVNLILTRYSLRRLGIETYVTTRRLHEGADIAQVSSTELLRLFNKCLRRKDDGTIWGWPALILGSRSGTYERRKPLPKNFEKKTLPGAFKQLLNDFPLVQDTLNYTIDGLVHPTGRKLAKLTVAVVYAAFKDACANVRTVEQYPFNVGNQAVNSVRKYIHAYLDYHHDAFTLWYGHASKKSTLVGTGRSGFQLASQPYDVAGMDAHMLDVVASIAIQTEHGPIRVPIRRIWVVVLRDYHSGAVLGYSISHGIQVSGEAVERALVHAQTPWRPRKLAPGLRYAVGAGLPCGTVPGIVGCPIAVLRMDNFTSNYSNVIQESARSVMGFHLNYGAVGAWWTNAPLERFFRTVADRFHLLVSSTGSGPHDATRPVDPNVEAVENEVDWELVHDMLDVILTEENTRPGAGRSTMTPLEVIRNCRPTAQTNWLPRFPAPQRPHVTRLGWEKKDVTLCGKKEKGQVRNVYFERFGRRYTSDKIVKNFALLPTGSEPAKLTVHMRQSDCAIEAYFPDGESIGEVRQIGGEPLFELSLDTLKRIYRRTDQLFTSVTYISERAALLSNVQALTDQAARDAEKHPYRTSKAASDLSEMAQRQPPGSPLPTVTANTERPRPAPPPTVPVHLLLKDFFDKDEVNFGLLNARGD